jgi:hypothetical protein
MQALLTEEMWIEIKILGDLKDMSKVHFLSKVTIMEYHCV